MQSEPSKVNKNISHKSRPDVMLSMVASLLPIVGLILTVLVPLAAAYSEKLALNYSLVVWTAGISLCGITATLYRLAYVAMEYSWEYLALVKYLRQRGLDNFAREAQKIKTLR